MASVHDLAAYILDWRAMSAMKLQKLVYYSQAWHLASTQRPLFSERIEAWANGPVVRELYDVHRGSFSVSRWPSGDKDALSPEERRTVDLVLSTYGGKPAQWLSDSTHAEAPWLKARGGLSEGARSEAPITPESMRAFYSQQLREGHGPEYAVARP